ncbi:hypothetical protein SARC_05673 [Sphaeroforma arctica JP610]|uniref:Uncharacterized protein n=1 Tax=Sphaeroforma arctica JP610 TaxID=667725 RepID=A0A0L0FZP0_9EUKA|nr:hypothetical protein SARC_05673 [Sphaeroforma arctica JP610]KNC82036.1 hypothetical protein SARC_05673 [Sphaeroforma arctica JP610]|eukprot:XP_014155938.1 hypothetical protein SARC_05673 [Sphaeroforma arctica JP610]
MQSQPLHSLADSYTGEDDSDAVFDSHVRSNHQAQDALFGLAPAPSESDLGTAERVVINRKILSPPTSVDLSEDVESDEIEVRYQNTDRVSQRTTSSSSSSLDLQPKACATTISTAGVQNQSPTEMSRENRPGNGDQLNGMSTLANTHTASMDSMHNELTDNKGKKIYQQDFSTDMHETRPTIALVPPSRDIFGEEYTSVESESESAPSEYVGEVTSLSVGTYTAMDSARRKQGKPRSRRHNNTQAEYEARADELAREQARIKGRTDERDDRRLDLNDKILPVDSLPKISFQQLEEDIPMASGKSRHKSKKSVSRQGSKSRTPTPKQSPHSTVSHEHQLRRHVRSPTSPQVQQSHSSHSRDNTSHSDVSRSPHHPRTRTSKHSPHRQARKRHSSHTHSKASSKTSSGSCSDGSRASSHNEGNTAPESIPMGRFPPPRPKKGPSRPPSMSSSRPNDARLDSTYPTDDRADRVGLEPYHAEVLRSRSQGHRRASTEDASVAQLNRSRTIRGDEDRQEIQAIKAGQIKANVLWAEDTEPYEGVLASC